MHHPQDHAKSITSLHCICITCMLAPQAAGIPSALNCQQQTPGWKGRSMGVYMKLNQLGQMHHH